LIVELTEVREQNVPKILLYSSSKHAEGIITRATSQCFGICFYLVARWILNLAVKTVSQLGRALNADYADQNV